MTDIYSLLSRNELDQFDAAVAALPDSSVREFLLGTRADRAHDTVVAINHYERALQFPDVDDEVAAQAPVRLTYCYQLAGDIDYAITIGEKHLLRMQTLSPFPVGDEVELRSILANCYVFRGEFLRAIALTAEKPTSSVGEILVGQWGWSRSVILFQAGFIEEALECGLETVARIDRELHPHFITGIEMNNDWMRSVLGQALTDEQLDDARERVRFFERSSSPDNATEMRLVLAYAHAVRGEHGEAREILESLMDAGSMSGAGLVRIATVYSAMGDSDTAEAIYRQSLDQLEDARTAYLVPAVWRKLASIYEARGETKSALESLKIAVEAAGVAVSASSDPHTVIF